MAQGHFSRFMGIGRMPAYPRTRPFNHLIATNRLHARYEPMAFAIAENELPLKQENIAVAFAAELHGYGNILACLGNQRSGQSQQGRNHPNPRRKPHMHLSADDGEIIAVGTIGIMRPKNRRQRYPAVPEYRRKDRRTAIAITLHRDF